MGNSDAAKPREHVETQDQDSPPRSRLWPGLAVTGAGVALAMIGHQLVEAVGVLTWAVVLGALAANLNLLPRAARPGVKISTKKFLRVGVVLLGFSLPLAAVAGLGPGVLALVVVTLVATLFVTLWLGLRTGVGRARSLLIATGFSICGASAIAAMEEHAEADEDDVATAIAMVTLCGSATMIALPLLSTPLGLSETQFGIWAGASVHEVGQVVAAASPVGAGAVAVAMAVKLTRVLLLAPVVAGASIMRRRAIRTSDGPQSQASTKLPALVPLFVLGFIVCALVRSLGVLGSSALEAISLLQTLALAAGLFGLGTGVHLSSLLRGGGRALTLAIASTIFVAALALAGVLIVR